MTKRALVVSKVVTVLLAAIAAGCTLVPEPRPAADRFDLGPRSMPAKQSIVIPATLLVPDVVAPSWLDGTGIAYRLSYENASRPRVYVNSRWVSPPAALLTERLRGRLTVASGGVTTGHEGARADYALRVELEDFSQYFSAPNASHVTMRARASLVRPVDRTLIAQRVFQVEQPAPTADAKGAVAALAGASDAAIERVVEWTGRQIRARQAR